MASTGLYYGTDFVLTHIYAKEDFSENSFVVKVKGSSVSASGYQKCKVYKSFNSDQLCIQVSGDKYILLNEDGTNYSIGGSLIGNYLRLDYTFMPNAATPTYNSNFVGIYTSGTWQQMVTNFTGIKAVSTRNTTTIPTTNEVFLMPKDPSVWKYYNGGTDLTMDIYTLDLSAYNPTSNSGKASKIMLDNEIAFITPVPTTREAFSGGYVNSDHLAKIVRIVRNASGTNVNPRGIFIQEPTTGMWIDKVTKMRVNYLAINLALSTASSTIYSAVNKDLLPVDFYKPADLGLEEISIPTLAESGLITNVVSFLTNLIDIKTVFILAAAYVGFAWIKGSGNLQIFRSSITGGGQ